MRYVKWIAAAAALAALSCGAPAKPAADEKPAAESAQLANPASVNCEEKGGKLEIVDTPEGQQGICVLADGTRCDEWAFLRGDCP
jgi:uncharacterized protein